MQLSFCFPDQVSTRQSLAPEADHTFLSTRAEQMKAIPF